MFKSIKDTVKLNNGVEMPVLGFGVFKIEDIEETKNSVLEALNVGYRSIDTAFFYENESGVADAVEQSGIPREQIFITTKLWNFDHGYDNALKAFDKSMANLRLDYLDLYLIHWPLPKNNKFIETWRALETIYKEKRVRAIGVSNFTQAHLERLLQETDIVPAVDQVEYHPYMQQDDLLAYLTEKGIYLEAWSPLSRGKVITDPVICAIAEKYGKQPAQVVLRWEIQKNIIVIPKSVKPERIESNADIFDFELADDDMEALNALHTNSRTGPDPDDFEKDAK
ncbi:MAG: aldo/keto reductase [Christensenellales bacterium]|jgi:diketogulonate reductase-like aldo/keto reductase